MDYIRSINLPTDDVMAAIPLTSRYELSYFTVYTNLHMGGFSKPDRVGLTHKFIIKSCRVKALLHHAEDQSKIFIPWDQVILVCADHMVAYLTSDLWASGFHGNSTTEMFPFPSEWLKAQAETTFNSLAQVTSKSTPGSVRKYAKKDLFCDLQHPLMCFSETS